MIQKASITIIDNAVVCILLWLVSGWFAMVMV